MRQVCRSTLIVFGCNLIVLFLLVSWNDFWAQLGAYFHLPGLFFLFGASRLDNSRGITVAVLTGLLIDASTASPFGLHAFGLVFCHLLARKAGEGMRSIHGLRPLVHLQAGNLFLLLVLSSWNVFQSPEGVPLTLGRIATDTILSQVLLLPVGMWFLAFQDKLLLYAGVDSIEQPAAP